VRTHREEVADHLDLHVADVGDHAHAAGRQRGEGAVGSAVGGTVGVCVCVCVCVCEREREREREILNHVKRRVL